ncbi:MAG: hypothetical protein INR71_12890 [Terriglobus roseus]|nr:hypothetical protein [Terriglobus roseus]
MRSSVALAACALTLLASAHPIADSRQRRSPPPYSVVNVDGSGADGTVPSATATTVKQTVTKTPLPATNTVVETETTQLPAQTTTLTLTDEHFSATTVVVTFTQSAPAASTVLVTEEHSHEAPTKTADSTVTVVSTVEASPSSTTEFYDDGMWHTYYPIRDYGSSSSSTSASETPSSASGSLTASSVPATPTIVDVETTSAPSTLITSSPSPTSSSTSVLTLTSALFTNGTDSIPATTSFSTVSSNAWWSVPTVSTPADYPRASSSSSA